MTTTAAAHIITADAAEDWAERLLGTEYGELPSHSVFEGDCHGLYINPDRLAVLGLRSTLTETVLIKPGDWVTFSTGEFLPGRPAAE